MKNIIFHLIGSASALSLVMLAVMIIPGLLKGDLEIIHEFFEQNPGSQPFVIFIMPVILLCGSAWLWKVFVRRESPNV